MKTTAVPGGLDAATLSFLDRVAIEMRELGEAPTPENIAAAMKRRLERERALVATPEFQRAVLRGIWTEARREAGLPTEE